MVASSPQAIASASSQPPRASTKPQWGLGYSAPRPASTAQLTGL